MSTECFNQQCRPILNAYGIPQMTNRQLPWMERDWNDQLMFFNKASGLEIVLRGELDSQALLYQPSSFAQGLRKSSFKNIVIHSNVEEVVFTHGLEKIGSRTPLRSLLLGRQEGGWYYYESHV